MSRGYAKASQACTWGSDSKLKSLAAQRCRKRMQDYTCKDRVGARAAVRKQASYCRAINAELAANQTELIRVSQECLKL